MTQSHILHPFRFNGEDNCDADLPMPRCEARGQKKAGVALRRNLLRLSGIKYTHSPIFLLALKLRNIHLLAPHRWCYPEFVPVLPSTDLVNRTLSLVHLFVKHHRQLGNVYI
jgi:hypothetical protein